MTATVKRKDSGGWVVVGPDKRESRPYHRQREARTVARRLVLDGGGGEIVIISGSGVRERETVPSRDRSIFSSQPPRDRTLFGSRARADGRT